MIHGIINVYKEKGYTSHDVVAKLRGIVGQKKIGHTGTLDPDATGVLPMCFGKATKLCDILTDKDKTYEAVMLLGKVTDTQDISGIVRSERDTACLTETKVMEAIVHFIGDYAQMPPMYSALKVKGRKLYELAREGIEVERKTRAVYIFSIRILEMALPRVRMEVKCSKGTYIRTLCHDIGQKLGCGGCMEELTRTQVGRFELGDSITLGEIRERQTENRLQEKVISIDEMFPAYPKMYVDKKWEVLAFNGNELKLEMLKADIECEEQECIRLYSNAGEFIAIYKYGQAEKKFTIVKMFYDGNGK